MGAHAATEFAEGVQQGVVQRGKVGDVCGLRVVEAAELVFCQRRGDLPQFVRVQPVVFDAEAVQGGAVLLQALPRFFAFADEDGAFDAQPCPQLPVFRELLPGGKAGAVDGEQRLMDAARRCRTHIPQGAQRPRQQARQVAPVEAQRPQRVEQHRRDLRQHAEVGHRIDLFGGDVASVAPGGAASDVALVEEKDGNTAPLQGGGNGQADDAAADDGQRRFHPFIPQQKGSSWSSSSSVCAQMLALPRRVGMIPPASAGR